VTGVSDAIDMRTQLQVIQLFFKDVKKIATLYNAGESNSVTSIDALQKEATKKNISVVLSAVSKTSEIEGAVRYLASLGIKILYIPNDNMVVSAMHLVSKLAHANDMIVVAADDGSVKMGADFAYAQNRGKLGEKLGDLANKILKNEKDLSLDNTYATSEELILYVNKKSLSKFKIPDKFKSVIMY
jgi:putative ABC transport system substrate-binding protein